MADGNISTRQALLQIAWLCWAVAVFSVKNIFGGKFSSIKFIGPVIIVSISALYALICNKEDISLGNLLSRRLVDTYIPGRSAYGNILRNMWIALMSLLLILIVLLVFPPFVPSATNYLASTSVGTLIASNQAEAKAWLDFSVILIEIAIAVAIGGAAFSERLASRIREKLQGWQVAYEQAGVEGTEHGVSETSNAAKSLRELVVKLQHFDFHSADRNNSLEFYKNAMANAEQTSEKIETLLLCTYPKVVRSMVASSLISSFPGGIYGMVAFTLFLLLMAAKVTQLYFG